MICAFESCFTANTPLLSGCLHNNTLPNAPTPSTALTLKSVMAFAARDRETSLATLSKKHDVISLIARAHARVKSAHARVKIINVPIAADDGDAVFILGRATEFRCERSHVRVEVFLGEREDERAAFLHRGGRGAIVRREQRCYTKKTQKPSA